MRRTTVDERKAEIVLKGESQNTDTLVKTSLIDLMATNASRRETRFIGEILTLFD